MSLFRVFRIVPVAITLFACACSSSTSGNTSGSDPCATGCNKQIALKCPKDTETLSACTAECQKALTTISANGCGQKATAYLDCVVSQPFVCDAASGKGGPTSTAPCKPQEDALDACAAPAPDSGPPG